MSERDFKLAVREYFAARDVFDHPNATVKQIAEASKVIARTEDQIRKELKRFTTQEVESLPL